MFKLSCHPSRTSAQQSHAPNTTCKFLNDVSNKGYRVCSKSLSKGMHILTSSTQDTAYNIGVGATTGGLVGSVGGPITMIAGAATGAAVAASNEVIGIGSKWIFSHVLSEKKSTQAASLIKFTLGISATYAATESIFRAVASVGLGFAGKTVSDTLVPEQSVHPVVKGAVDATFGALGCLAGHGVGQQISNISYSSHAEIRRTDRQVEPLNCSNRSEPTIITTDQNLSGAQGECGHYQVTGYAAKLTITGEAGYRSKIIVSSGATVSSEGKSLKEAEVSQQGYYDYIEMHDHAGKGDQLNQEGVHDYADFYDDSFEEGKLNQKTSFNYARFRNNAGQGSEINELGSFDRVQMDGSAGKISELNLEGPYSDAYLQQKSGQWAKIKLTGDYDAAWFEEDSVRWSYILLRSNRNMGYFYQHAAYEANIIAQGEAFAWLHGRSANHSNITSSDGASVFMYHKAGANSFLHAENNATFKLYNGAAFKANMLADDTGEVVAYDNSGNLSHAVTARNGAIATHNEAFFRANITVKTNALFTAFDYSCRESNVIGNGGTVKISSPTAFLNATVLICNGTKIYNSQGQLLTQDNLNRSTLIKSFIDRNSINTDELCQPIPGRLNTDNSLLLGLLSIVFGVIIVATPAGIFLYIKRDKIKQCRFSCKKNGYKVIQNSDLPTVTYTRTKAKDGQTHEYVSISFETIPRSRPNACNIRETEAELNASVISIELPKSERHKTKDDSAVENIRTDDETIPLLGKQRTTHKKGAKFWV